MAAAFTVAALAAANDGAKDTDPYLWLSDVQGAKALDWVQAQNAKSNAILKSDPEYGKDRDAILTVLNANDRIPDPQVDHQWVFNFWQDAQHVRGLWRLTTIADYAAKEPRWQVL